LAQKLVIKACAPRANAGRNRFDDEQIDSCSDPKKPPSRGSSPRSGQRGFIGDEEFVYSFGKAF